MKKKLICGLLFGAIAAGGYASELDGIFSFKMGQFEVYMLVERQNPGNAGILVGADTALLDRYIPASGFVHGTNTFLIKAPGMNILVDTGFGGAVFDKIKALGVEPHQINAVLLTHLHGDHIGGLLKDGKPAFANAKIYLDTKEKDHFTKVAVNQGAVAALGAYGQNVVAFDALPFGPVFKEIFPGVRAIASYGHTPGHTIYLLESGNEKFIIGGDFLHVALVQFPRPDISATYDTDKTAAAASRRQIMEYAAANRIPIGGMHMVYPAVGSVEPDGNGFRFVPMK